jgi:flagellin-like protein
MSWLLTGDLRRSRTGGRGQSETIGVVLLVAVVIVLAAGVGQFVFGLDIVQGGEQDIGPQISFDTTVGSDGNVTIRHSSGNTARTDALSIVGSEAGTLDVGSFWTDQGVGSEWTASESITLDGDALTAGETIRIIWESSTTDDSTVILNFEYQP